MNKTDEALFRQALTEGVSNRFSRQIESCTETVVCSRRHRAAISKIINDARKQSHAVSIRIRKIIAILVAAVMLLVSCAVVYRDEIRDFIEEIYESFVKINYSDGDDQGAEIKDVYELTYMPEGYQLEDELLLDGMLRITFSNSNGQIIVFEQHTLDTAVFFADIENGYTKIVDISIYDVYYKETKQQTYYMWNDGKSSLVLISKITLSDEELKLIIEGIKTK
ncbi:MAG: DUF4367 domain-containing protein [Ruminococcaceae bacterium]|nr:DUF4367 domain-containing protein [Oscillospiraceae bacterium]